MDIDSPGGRAGQAARPAGTTDRHATVGTQTTVQVLARVGALAAFMGAILLFVSTMLHPAGSNPNNHHAAFTEYAADSLWVWSHLGQFLGFVALAVALGALASTLEPGRPAAWGRIGLFGAVALLALAAALQAVDGIALKIMVDRWVETSGEAQLVAFEAAFAVRQIEIGLASFLSLVSGLTMMVFGVAMILSERYPMWLGGIGLLGGLGTFAGGLAQATTGFSDLAMTLSMPSSFVLLVWAIVVGVLMWRLAPKLACSEPS